MQEPIISNGTTATVDGSFQGLLRFENPVWSGRLMVSQSVARIGGSTI